MPSSGIAIKNGNILRKVEPPPRSLCACSTGGLTPSVLTCSVLTCSALGAAPLRYELTHAGKRLGTTPSGVRRSTTLGIVNANAEATALRGALTCDAMALTASPPIALSTCSGVTGVFEPRLTQDETVSPRPMRLN